MWGVVTRDVSSLMPYFALSSLMTGLYREYSIGELFDWIFLVSIWIDTLTQGCSHGELVSVALYTLDPAEIDIGAILFWRAPPFTLSTF